MRETHATYAYRAIRITELRRHPAAVIKEARDAPMAILTRNRATAYLVSADTFEALMSRLEDLELAQTVRSRRYGRTIKVSLKDL